MTTDCLVLQGPHASVMIAGSTAGPATSNTTSPGSWSQQQSISSNSSKPAVPTFTGNSAVASRWDTDTDAIISASLALLRYYCNTRPDSRLELGHHEPAANAGSLANSTVFSVVCICQPGQPCASTAGLDLCNLLCCSCSVQSNAAVAAVAAYRRQYLGLDCISPGGAGGQDPAKPTYVMKSRPAGETPTSQPAYSSHYSSSLHCSRTLHWIALP